MKTRTFFLFVLLQTGSFFLFSCNNKHLDQPQVNSKSLPGVWEYRNRIGGNVPFTPDEFKPGNGRLWRFTADSFQLIYKETVQRSGTYAIANTGIDPNSGRHVNQFIFNGDSLDVFELRDDTLRFYYGFIPADGAIEMYVKISEDTMFAKEK